MDIILSDIHAWQALYVLKKNIYKKKTAHPFMKSVALCPFNCSSILT